MIRRSDGVVLSEHVGLVGEVRNAASTTCVAPSLSDSEFLNFGGTRSENGMRIDKQNEVRNLI